MVSKRLKWWLPKVETTPLKIADLLCGFCLMGYYASHTPGLNVHQLASSAWKLSIGQSSFVLYDLHKVSSQGGWLILCILRFGLWATWATNWAPVHWIWSMKLPKKIHLMPGGFAPRASALTLGALLFVSQTLINEQTMGGSDLAKASKWKPRECCFADHTTPAGPVNSYFFLGPYYSPPDGCFNTIPGHGDDIYFSHPPFRKKEVDPQPPNLIHPIRNGTLVTDVLCQYMCTTQRGLEMTDILQKAGIIVSGAGIATIVSDALTTKFGWHLVTEDTSPTMLKKLVSGWLCSGLGDDGFRGSALACALQVHFFTLLLTTCAVLFCGHSSVHSVNFKVNYVIISGYVFAQIQRWWSPMTLRAIIYTKRLWMEGEDEFFVISKMDDGTFAPELKKIDLYTWIHSHRIIRALHLLRYAMRLDTHTKSGTSVRCILACKEWSVVREGHVWSTDNTDLTVLCRHRVHIPVGATGTVKEAQGGRGDKDKMVVKWDEPINEETLAERDHLVENCEEWNSLADEFTDHFTSYQHQKQDKRGAKKKKGEFARTLSQSSGSFHEASLELLWGVTSEKDLDGDAGLESSESGWVF